MNEYCKRKMCIFLSSSFIKTLVYLASYYKCLAVKCCYWPVTFVRYCRSFVSVDEQTSWTRHCRGQLCGNSVSCCSYIVTCVSKNVAVMNNMQLNCVSMPTGCCSWATVRRRYPPSGRAVRVISRRLGRVCFRRSVSLSLIHI